MIGSVNHDDVRYYLHDAHGSGCAHCRRVVDRVQEKLHHVQSVLFEMQMGYLTGRIEDAREQLALKLAEDVVRQCNRTVWNEWREKQDSWL